MSEQWAKEYCPHCQAANWLCLGDPSDMTIPDIEVCRCWSCEKRFFLDEEGVKDIRCNEVKESCGEDDAEYETWDDYLQKCYMVEWGRKNPTDPYKWSY